MKLRDKNQDKIIKNSYKYLDKLKLWVKQLFGPIKAQEAHHGVLVQEHGWNRPKLSVKRGLFARIISDNKLWSWWQDEGEKKGASTWN